jgi:hypothetical protein
MINLVVRLTLPQFKRKGPLPNECQDVFGMPIQAFSVKFHLSNKFTKMTIGQTPKILQKVKQNPNLGKSYKSFLHFST